MLDDLYSEYRNEYEVNRSNLGSEDILQIGNNGDWVMVEDTKMGVYNVMYKEDGKAGTPEKSSKAKESNLEEVVEEFVSNL